MSATDETPSAAATEPTTEVQAQAPEAPAPTPDPVPEQPENVVPNVHDDGELRVDGMEAVDGYIKVYGIRKKSGAYSEEFIAIPEAVTRYEAIRVLLMKTKGLNKGPNGGIDRELQQRMVKMMEMLKNTIEAALVQVQNLADYTAPRIVVPDMPGEQRTPSGLIIP